MKKVLLKNLLIYVRENVPYYAEYISEDIQTVDGDTLLNLFKQIPIVHKKTMSQAPKQFISKQYIDENIEDIVDFKKNFINEYVYIVGGKTLVAEYSSGTTGTPGLSVKTADERMKLGSQLWKLRRQVMNIRMKNFFNFIHNFGPTQYPFPFPIDPKDTPDEKIIKELNYLSKSDIKWWHINAYRLDVYSDVMKRYPVTFPELRVIENNGSYMSEDERRNVKNSYNCKVVDNYGCREVWTIAFSCKDDYLHVNDENIIFELIDDNGQEITEAGIVGNVVVTSLAQYAMPYIRYYTGDLAQYVEGKCSCGNCARRIRIIPGRNYIIGTNVYGNIHFRSVVRSVLCRDVEKFDSLCVRQTDVYTFNVYISARYNKEEKVEKYFKEISNNLLNSDKYQYHYFYNETLQPKSLFTVAKQQTGIEQSKNT